MARCKACRVNSPLKKSGSGPIFGETACFARESLAENLDLTPFFHFFNGLLLRLELPMREGEARFPRQDG